MTTTFTTHFRFGLPDFLSSPWQVDWYTLVQLMDQVLYETALGTIIDVWANSTVYAVGNLRIDPNLGTIWTCLVAHTSAASPTTFATDRTNHSTFWGAFTVVDGDKGYITVSGSNSVYTINDDVVSNAKLSNMGQATFKMRAAGAGTGDPIDGTAAQAKTALAIAFSDITGFGAGISTWLTTPSSANLLAAVTDETGTGALVFGTSPTIATPALTSPVITSGTVTTSLKPTANDGAPLGDTTHNFSDLFIAAGGVINWNNSDVTITHGTDLLTFAGAANGFLFSNPYGYAVGAGGAVTQATSKATSVALNFPTGEITMNGAALAAATIVSFAFSCSGMTATDIMNINHVSGGTLGSYTINASCGTNLATVYVRNNTAGSLSEAIVLRYTLVRGQVS